MSIGHTSGVSASAQKNGGSAETGRQGKINMLNVAEKPAKDNLFAKLGGKFVTASPDKKAAEWLDDQVAKAKDNISTFVADLTPALARALLNRNNGNRKLSETFVTSYARDIANDAWQFNGEPIIISADGLLNDGQHRCAAVNLADRAISCLFVVGVQRDTRTTLDQGKTRTVGDYLSMGGHAYVNHLGAAANFCWQFTNYSRLARGGHARATKSELLAFIDKHPEIATSVDAVQRKGADAVGGRSVLAFIHYTTWKAAGRKTADAFMNALIEGANLPAKHPILYVRNRLINERGRLHANDRAELIVKAWNAYRRNDESTRHFEITGNIPKVEK